MIGFVMAMMFASATTATAPTSAPQEGHATVVIVVGASGTGEFGDAFAHWADEWKSAAARGGEQVIEIGRDHPSTSPSSSRPTTAESDTDTQDRDRLKHVLDDESARSSREPLWLVLLGHGTFDGHDAKFNLRGMDVSASELADWLRNCHRPLAIIDCSAASAPFLNKLSGENRVIVTATRAGSEIQFAHFGQYLAAAIGDPAADLDKDGQTSLLEAFIAASHATDEFYKQQGRLATEHPLLDDNGDALGTPATFFQGIRATKSAREGASLDGSHAHQWHLVRSAQEQSMPPELAKRRDQLELQIESLRQKKRSMSETDYYQQLEPLLIDLAKVYESSEGEGK